jgi:tripartite-type tricarboxylate transporter receptor subunit TctC
VAARAAPDGYTLLINSAHSTVPAIVARVPYDSVKDFVGIAIAGFSPYVMVANPNFPVRSIQELVTLLKANPGRYNMATAGIGSGVHVAAELFCSVTDVKVELVHYRGGGPSVAALVAGESQFGAPTMASSLGQVRGGGVRALAVLAEQRSPALPNVPSAVEAGIPRVIVEEFFPILAPAATPAPIVAALGTAFRTAIQQSAAKLNELAGVSPREGFDTPDKVMKVVADGVEQYSSILRAANVPQQ